MSAPVIRMIAGNELRSLLRSPVGWLAFAAFLAINGFGFWSVVESLSDPSRAPEPGAVLSTFLGGTLLGYTVTFAVLAALVTRALAEERSRGVLESLMAVPVSDSELVVGKWLGSYLVYLAMWSVTLIFVAVFVWVLPPGQALDPGPVLAGYLAVGLAGAALAGLAVAVSAGTRHPVVAFIGALFVQLAWLLGSELVWARSELAASALTTRGVLTEAFALRASVMALCEGEVGLTQVIALVGITVVALATAHLTIGLGRLGRSELGARAVFALLLATALALLSIWSARHPHALDVTRAKQHSLAPALVAALAAVDGPTTLHLVPPMDARFDDTFAEVVATMARAARAQPLVVLDVADSAAKLASLSSAVRDAGVSIDDLAQGGAVIVERQHRVRVLEAIALAEYSRDALGVGHAARYRSEGALADALVELSADGPARVCVMAGHEAVGRLATGGWATVWELARREQMIVSELESALAIPPECAVVVLAEPLAPLAPAMLTALTALLQRGGGLLVWWPDPQRVPTLDRGLALITRAHGIEVGAETLDDPRHRVGIGGAWGTVEGDPTHPISAPVAGRRVSVWLRPRALRARAEAAATASSLVRASAEALVLDAAGVPVQVPSADSATAPRLVMASERAETAARLVVFGGGASLSQPQVTAGATPELVVRSLAWLARRETPAVSLWKAPEYVRLQLDAAARRRLFVACVLLVPLLVAGLLAGLHLRRRRRG